MQVHDAAREASAVQQLEVDPDLAREPAGAAADDDRRDELVQLVDQPGRERLAGQVRAADADVLLRRGDQLADRRRVERPLDPGARGPGASSVVE